MFGFFLVLLAFVFTQQAWQKKEMRVAAAVLVIYTALHAVLTWTGYLGAGEMAWAIGQALHLPLPVFIELFEDKDMHPLFRTDMDLPIRLSFTVSAAGYALIAYYFTRWRSKDKGNQDGGKKNPEGLLRTITRMTDLS
jgi:hypothetical protein